MKILFLWLKYFHACIVCQVEGIRHPILAFVVTESIVTPIGVIVVNYERVGAITTGSL